MFESKNILFLIRLPYKMNCSLSSVEKKSNLHRFWFWSNLCCHNHTWIDINPHKRPGLWVSKHTDTHAHTNTHTEHLRLILSSRRCNQRKKSFRNQQRKNKVCLFQCLFLFLKLFPPLSQACCICIFLIHYSGSQRVGKDPKCVKMYFTVHPPILKNH